MIHYFRRLIAKIRRTFVTDCPRCYKYFFGFHPYAVQLKFDKHYRIVCHNCALEHQKKIACEKPQLLG